jgi:hypothetical protein
MIRQILARGYDEEDFYRVHEVKCLEWLDSEKMNGNLRPSTLYRPSNFDAYLAEWWAMEMKRKAKSAPQPAHQEQNSEKAEKAEKAERDLIERLMGRKWWEFGTWGEFVRWTIQLPTAEAVAKYEMPERIRRMRTAPGMVMNVLKGRSPEWAEAEYKEIKRTREVNGER